MYNMANMNFYGIMEQPTGVKQGNGIIIDGMLHADKSIIAGSIRNRNCGSGFSCIPQSRYEFSKDPKSL
jgi:hypothetical protein